MTYFSDGEVLRSGAAIRHGLQNYIDGPEVMFRLWRLRDELLDPIREQSGQRILITEGYRNVTVNKAAGGVANSAHVRGLAADVVPLDGMGCPDLFDLIRKSELPFDQVILETETSGAQCVHIALAEEGHPPRRQALVRHGVPPACTYEAVT